jgi:hypothetical protein
LTEPDGLDRERFDLMGDERIARPWRIGLVIIGLAAVAGGLFFGFVEIVTLGTSYAHDSNPTPEFKAAGDAKMMLALLLVVFGVTCLACRRANHLLMVGTAALALALCAAIAAGRDKASRDVEQPYAIAVQPDPPPPTDIVVPPARSQ